MSPRSFRHAIFCGGAVAAIVVSLAGGALHAQGAQFAQRERVTAAMDSSPEWVATAIESVLTQEQITAIESALFPAPTEDEQRAALDTVKEKLLRAGFAKDDPLVSAVSERAEAIAASVDAAPAPSAQE